MTEYEQNMLNLTREILENTKKTSCPELQKIQIMQQVVDAARDLRSVLITHGLPYAAKMLLATMYTAIDKLPVEKQPELVEFRPPEQPKKSKVA